jgi:hypothetical protein
LVRKLIRAGKLAAFKIPGARGVRIAASAVAQFEQEQSVAPKPMRRRQRKDSGFVERY